MKETRITMGMPATIEIVAGDAKQEDLEKVFNYFDDIDQRFSTYKKDSEISKFNRGEISRENLSEDMQEIFNLSEETKKETSGYFDINFKEITDPSGLVKGLAIHRGAEILRKLGYKNFYVEIAGDIEVEGLNNDNKPWAIGIRSPFNRQDIIKVVKLNNKGIATSGTSIRGEHITNPLTKSPANEIVSLTVIGPNIYEADRFATAAFAMGTNGINFIEQLQGFEGYMIDQKGIATFTSNFNKYVL